MRRFFVCVVLTLSFNTGLTHELAEVMNDVLPAVTYIQVEQFVVRETIDPITKTTETIRVPTSPIIGTGFVIDNNNVVTNYHVIAFAVKNNTKVFITFYENNQKYQAKILGYDKIADIALLSIEGKHPSVKISGKDSVRMGDPVFSISHFYGIGWSGTQGTVSSNTRRDARYPYINNLQLQLLQGSGSSGGPVFNIDGDVIALNRSIVSMFPRSPIPYGGSMSMLSMVGYPIRGDTLLETIKNIRNDMIVVHLDLGVTLMDFGPDSLFHLNYASGDDDFAYGTMVMSIDDGNKSPFLVSDIIVSIEGRAFDSPAKLLRWLNDDSGFKAGNTINVQVYRNGELLNIAVQILLAGL